MTTPTDFSNNIHTYSTKFPGILDNFIQAFKNHLKSPADTATTSIYGTAESNLQGIISDLFITTNNIQVQINTKNTVLSTLDNNIDGEISKQTTLNEKLTQIEGNNNGAAEMIDNTLETYKSQYTSNILIILGIFLTLWLLFTIFKKQNGNFAPTQSYR
jgi:hypothetical protein